MPYMIISFSGAPGSGKSTIAQRLADKLGYARYYMGGLRREAARRRGLTLAEYNQLGETDPATDREVDEYQAELGRQEKDFVIEGRTSWYFIPHSVKIYLDVSPEEGARRVFLSLQGKAKEERNEDDQLDSQEAVRESMESRVASDRVRYRKYYGIDDVYDHSHYDLYLDTTGLDQDQVFARVWDFVSARLDKGKN